MLSGDLKIKHDVKVFGKVAVLLGGDSAEREISLESGHAVLSALLEQGVDAHGFDSQQQNISDLKTFDRAFIMLHGRYGEDGTVQGELEALGVPYTGSGVKASAVGMDKWQTKLAWDKAGIVTPAYTLITADSDFGAVAQDLGIPLFVKPANEGSSIGISKVKTAGDLKAAYELAVKTDPFVIAEQFVGGGEYTVGVVGNTALPIVRIETKTDFYDYEAKYSRDDTEYLCPCGLDEALEEQIKREALAAFNAIGCSGWGRVDFLMDEAGKHYFLELNTIPGMTSHSLVPMAAKAIGVSFDELVLLILQTSLAENTEKMTEKKHVG